ncbi:MAG TPA: hypothetical protein VEI01_25640 [Terriglobales bacterium]|nr:hypothetical protein [Terriglobales bacterium]
MKNERLVRLFCVSIAPALLLKADRDRVCAKVEIKLVGHVDYVLFSVAI